MPSDCISLQDSGYFTPLITDYLSRNPDVEKLYSRFPEPESFRQQIQEKKAFFPTEKRKVLVDALRRQYADTDASLQTLANLESLSSDNTFTVVTGHQLNLFTGPLYFLYKIVTALNLAKKLAETYPEQQFVPVFWMASEDHDFDEINHFSFQGRKYAWNRESGGAVGRLDTDGLQQVFDSFSATLGTSKTADELRNLFTKAYLEHDNLTDATRWLGNALFSEYGLIIIDGDDRELKRELAPYVREDLFRQTAFEQVNDTISRMKGYTVQVNPREINVFYLMDGVRERIVQEGTDFRVVGTNLRFTAEQLEDELLAYPERFSPNVILRPLYQEVILPNLCYIGGGGEIAYWLELKAFFESQKVPFPILMLRNSVLLATEKQDKKRQAMQLSWADLFADASELENRIASRLTEFPTELPELRKTLEEQFRRLKEIVAQTDKSFEGAVLAQEAKQLKGLTNLEKRLQKAERRKYADQTSRALALKQELFPGGLQERKANFSEAWLELGYELIPMLMKELDPFEAVFDILVY